MLPQLVSAGFQVLFHSPPGVLFTFPSRYYALSVAISYLALGGGPPCFPPDFSCPVVLWYQLCCLLFRVRGFHALWPGFPSRSTIYLKSLMLTHNPEEHAPRFGLFPFRSPLLRKSIIFFLFLRVLRCFTSPGPLLHTYVFSMWFWWFATSEFPHSDICGSMLTCSSPQLFAACHVLLRRMAPRHPPCALCSLIFFVAIFFNSKTKRLRLLLYVLL